MNYQELLTQLERVNKRTRNQLIVKIATGGRHMVDVSSVNEGFDWEKGRLIITPAEPLYIRTENQEIEYLLKQFDLVIQELIQVKQALRAARRLCDEALPKFNWGASALDANAIQLLNQVPALIRQTLKE